MSKIYENIIVGSSISSTGLLLSQTFDENNSCIIDAGEIFKKKNFEIEEKKLFRYHDVKSKKSQNDIGKDYSTISDNEKIFNLSKSSSFMFGGYSNVWGAYSCIYDKNELSEMGINHSLNFDLIDKEINLNNIKDFDQNDINIINTPPKDLKEIETFLSIDKRCKPCGSCLYGCPENYIYNTKNTFSRLSKKIKTYKNFLLNKFSRKHGIYEIEIISTQTNEIKIIYGKKIFLGSGPLNTIKILLKSFPEITKIYLKDSQSFYLPLVEKKLPTIKKQKNRIELTNKSYRLDLDNYSVRCQIYHFGKFLRNHIKKIIKVNMNSFNFLFSRSHIMLFFLPSDKSSLGSFRMNKDRIEFNLERKYDAEYLKNVIKKFKKNIGKDLFFLTPLIRKREIYDSYHFGSISVQIDSKIYNTNTKTGLINHTMFENIYLIDGSCLEKIPSGPISRVIMANSHNIGKTHAK